MLKVLALACIVVGMLLFVTFLNDVLHCPGWFTDLAAIAESAVFALGMTFFSRNLERRR